ERSPGLRQQQTAKRAAVGGLNDGRVILRVHFARRPEDGFEDVAPRELGTGEIRRVGGADGSRLMARRALPLEDQLAGGRICRRIASAKVAAAPVGAIEQRIE